MNRYAAGILSHKVKTTDFFKLVYHNMSLSSKHENMRSYKTTKTLWPESESELYRPSDRSLLAKLVPTFADRGCHVVSMTDPYGRNLGFLDQSRYSFFQVTLQLYSHETEWTPFRYIYFSVTLPCLHVCIQKYITSSCWFYKTERTQNWNNSCSIYSRLIIWKTTVIYGWPCNDTNWELA
jgi:hypothetical protein